MIALLRASSRGSLLQVLKTSVAAIIAWLICTATLGQPLPIFAAIAALLVVQPSVNQSFAKGIERSAGVILGVVLAYVASLIFGHSSFVVLAIIVVALLVAWGLKLSPGSTVQIPISALLVLAIGAQTPGYAVNRVIETIIGAIVGLVVNAAIVPPVLIRPANEATHRLAARVASTLNGLAQTLRDPATEADLDALLEHARELRPLQDKALAALKSADDSLRLNPRRGQHRTTLERDRELLVTLGVLVTRVIGMARALHDRYSTELAEDPIAASIATELDRAAHDLLLIAREIAPAETIVAGHAPDRQPIAAELPALTAPLVVARPGSANWILLGSLLEDLRRVREEIIGADE